MHIATRPRVYIVKFVSPWRQPATLVRAFSGSVIVQTSRTSVPSSIDCSSLLSPCGLTGPAKVKMVLVAAGGGWSVLTQATLGRQPAESSGGDGPGLSSRVTVLRQ